jgi:peptide/nickel transport system permease protein
MNNSSIIAKMEMVGKLLKNPSSAVGLVIVIIYLTMALLAPVIVPADPLKMNPADSLKPPNARFLAGTDQFGRDMLSRIIFGVRVSLYISLISVGLATLIGGIIGSVVGYIGGRMDDLIMRIVDIMISFPPLILALSIVAFLGSNINNIIIAIATTYTPIFIRMARGSAIALREVEFVQATIALGSSLPRIIRHHIWPNITPLIIIQASLALSWAILTEAALSFLGLGVQPPTPSWGAMLGEGRQFMVNAPWLAIFPGIAITLAVIGFNLLGDGLRDILDPRLRK